MKIAIIGTRGIPNNYGGFEQFAEYLSIGLVNLGHEVTVFNSDSHTYQNKEYNGVTIQHCYDPERYLGTFGQFIYDLNCILVCRRSSFDIIYQLGYTSSSIWGWLLPSKATIITNMDGLEWKRSKFSSIVKLFLQFGEKLTLFWSDFLIADSIGIKHYIEEKYQRGAIYIPYGADIFLNPNQTCLEKFNLFPYRYNLLIARLEPENNIDLILEGVVNSNLQLDFLVIGNYGNTYGTGLKNKYSNYSHIKFIGGIYDINLLNNLRFYSNLYFHGHSVGGTNPSLLEAMASYSLICAHDNIFNKSILNNDAYYFKTPNDIVDVLKKTASQFDKNHSINYSKLRSNVKKIETDFSWEHIITQYEELFLKVYKKNNR